MVFLHDIAPGWERHRRAGSRRTGRRLPAAVALLTALPSVPGYSVFRSNDVVNVSPVGGSTSTQNLLPGGSGSGTSA